MQQGRLQRGNGDQLVEEVDEVEVVLFSELEPVYLDEAAIRKYGATYEECPLS